MDIDFDKEYSPSRWSKRFKTGDEVISNHVRFAKQESDRIRATISFESIAYGTEPSENCDLFGTDLPDGLYIADSGSFNKFIMKY